LTTPDSGFNGAIFGRRTSGVRGQLGGVASERVCWNVEVLGPIRVLDAADGRDVTPVGALQRRLLALLVLHRGRVVSAEAAVEALWPSRRPQNPVAALQNHLSRLRRELPEGVVESMGDGYRLDPARVDLDADRLAGMLRADVSAEPSVVAEIDAVLARWTGPAYPELEDTDEGRAESMRLAELRTRALEQRAELQLSRGDTAGLVAELAALTEAEPLRERPRSLLMSALAAAGRHVEALRVYDDFRRLLSEELGIEPSPTLTDQHARLLRGETPGAWTPTKRLPVPATSLIGRDALVAEVAALAEEQRMVALVGPGGVGKTRVLVEVGHRLRGRQPDRPVVLCELAATDPAAAVDAVAAALGIDARPGVPPAQRVADVVGDREIVMLLDSCEHVLDPVAALVDHLLAACPGARVLATSRERLRVAGEQVCAVPPLPAASSDAPAVRLFVERAQAVAPGFEPDADGLACIVEIARRLDGLPLAIELAAARLHTHDVGEVAAGLDQRFSLLSSGYRASSRHASLGAAIAWSYGLLDPSLQQTFADVSVFSEPFTAADAAAVCDIDEGDATAALAQLVERSLLMRVAGRRYVLLETLRAFGADRLAASDRAGDVAERHARHQVDWIEQTDRQLLEPGEAVVARIDAALPELRTALSWLLAHDEVVLAGRLVAALFDYGILRLRPDVLAWSEQVTRSDPEDRSPLAPRVWAAAAYAAWMSGDRAETSRCGARALRAAEAAGGELPAGVAVLQGSVALFEGRLSEACAWYRRGVEAASAEPSRRLFAAGSELLALGYAGDPAAVDRSDALLAEVGERATPHAAYVWYCAGEAYLSVDTEEARARLARAQELAERASASFVIGLAGASRASIDARVGDPHAAAAEYRWLIDHWRRAGMWSTQWTMLRSIAILLHRLGRHRDAAVLEGAVRATEAGHRIFGADEVALAELGDRLRSVLGEDAYETARREGSVLDGDAAVEHALRAL
jgi:predicted ATPase/DNA-binding SARP family transcriptional activator